MTDILKEYYLKGISRKWKPRVFNVRESSLLCLVVILSYLHVVLYIDERSNWNAMSEKEIPGNTEELFMHKKSHRQSQNPSTRRLYVIYVIGNCGILVSPIATPFLPPYIPVK